MAPLWDASLVSFRVEEMSYPMCTFRAEPSSTLRRLRFIATPKPTLMLKGEHRRRLFSRPRAYRHPVCYSFDPDRWLKPTDAMKNAFIPFGGGTRSKDAFKAFLARR